MVRLKVLPGSFVMISVGDFNSTMVRLKASVFFTLQDTEDDFNSTMVRLKAAYPSGLQASPVISIPLWYD